MIINYKKRFRFIFLCLLPIPLSGCISTQKQPNPTINDTGDMLQKVSDDICFDKRTGLIWQIGKSSKFSSPQLAEEYAKKLHLSDHDTWRLPTREELFTLHDTFFRHLNGDCDLNPAGNYWATTTDGEIVSGRWKTDYLCGPEYKYVESYDNKGYVRAIRQGK